MSAVHCGEYVKISEVARIVQERVKYAIENTLGLK